MVLIPTVGTDPLINFSVESNRAENVIGQNKYLFNYVFGPNDDNKAVFKKIGFINF